MRGLPEDLVKAVADMAREVSTDTARSVATRAQALDAERAGRLVTEAPTAVEAELLRSLVAAWARHPEVDGLAVGLALLSAQNSASAERSRQQIELIWTGPAGSLSAMRRTDQALLEVISSARERLLIVTFAAYDMGSVVRGIVEALDRGVRVAIVLEFSEEVDGSLDSSRLTAFGTQVRDRATVYYWPFEKRERVGRARGVLHVKCAVADAKVAYVSSANLTGSAMNRNMELGLLIQGGSTPYRIERHFDELIRATVLEPFHA